MLAGDLKNGVRIEIDGDPFVVLELARKSPSARGASTLITMKLRNLRTKQQVMKTYKTTDNLKQPDFEIRPWTYLYAEGEEAHHFMDQETFEQAELPTELIEYELGFLLPESQVRALIFNGECIGIELEHTVVLRVADCDPGVKGDTVSAVTKSARLETGVEIQVPIFIERDDMLVVDTRERRYVRRA